MHKYTSLNPYRPKCVGICIYILHIHIYVKKLFLLFFGMIAN